MGTFGGDVVGDKTNPIRRYYVVPIVIAIVSIIIFSQIWIIMKSSKRINKNLTGIGITALIVGVAFFVTITMFLR